MRRESIGHYTAGGWRRARRAFQCVHVHHVAHGGGEVRAGEEYYDTCEGLGLDHYFATLRLCAACAERARYPSQRSGVNHAGD